MKINSKIIRRRSGKSKDKWVLRISYFDEIAGRDKHIERNFDLKAAAIDERSRLTNELRKTHGQSREGDRMTFQDLVAVYEEHFYKPAVIVQGRKVAGIKSYKTVSGHLKMLKAFFGARLLRHVTPESLTDYRLWRIEQGSQRGKQENRQEISLATVNRELSSLRTLMAYAFEKGWIAKALSFKRSIDKEAEKERTRILTADEEVRLLAACQGEREITYERTRRGKVESITAVHIEDNRALKAILLLAMDSGLRKSEILRLDWADFDFEKGLVHVLESHTKTQRSRLAPLTVRTIAELRRVKMFAGDGPPFPFKNFSGSFETAKKIAGITDLHFHDLRRHAIVKWTLAGTPLNIAGKAAGHSQLQTTHRHYLSVDEEMMQNIARTMNTTQNMEAENDLVN